MTELWSLPATAIAALLRAREVSAREIAASALARLDAVNPAINAVVDPTPQIALAAADRVDACIAAGDDPGPLAGVPVTVKVNVDMAGRATTNGLALQKDLIAESDSPVVANFARSGALILGRTNTPAFSLRWFTRNRLHGATLNPHDPALTPGGSSGGAAAAVAAGIGAAAHGTDIAGSIRYPAHACGVHGLRPTLGRVAAANLSGADRSIAGQMTAVSGPLARRIGDLGLMLGAMAGGDARDPWWVPAPLSGPALPRRAALSLAPGAMATAPGVRAALDRAARALEAAGWEVGEADPPGIRHAAQLNMSLWMEEFRVTGRAKLEAEGDPDAIAVAAHLSAIAAEGPGPLDALQARLGLLRAWQGFLEDWPILLCPVSAEPPFADHRDLEGPDAFAAIFEAQLLQVGLPVLGLPALTVAVGAPGAPIGVQLVAPRFREDLLLAAGTAIEAAVPPVDPVTPGG